MTHHPNKVIEICVNLDDASGELLGQVIEQLLAAGALDVWTTPIGMKKQRPGVCLSLLCPPEQRDEMAGLTLRLTGSFGVRHRAWDRTTLERQHVAVITRYGELRLKVGYLDGKPIVAKPEYEDARRLAEKLGTELRLVLAAGIAAGDQWLASQQ